MLSAVARWTATRAAVTILLLTLAAACGPSGDKATPTPTVTVATEPARTTTTNPYAVPAVIDVAYVNRVLAGLDAVMGDVTRLVATTKTIRPEAYDRMKSVFPDNDRLQRAIDSFQRDLRNNLTGYKPNPGNKTSTVTDLITASPGCIFTEVRRNYSAVSTSPSAELEVQWIGLRPLDPARDPYGYNATRWVYVYERVPPNHAQPPNPCTA